MARILIVDDDRDLLLVLQDALEAGGHEIFVAESVGAAQQSLTAIAFDLLITDIMLPDGDGIGLIKWLGQERLALPVIAMSGGTSSFPASATLGLSSAYGAARTLFKPFQIREVLAVVEEVLGKGGLAQRPVG